MANLVQVWNPDTETLTLHRFAIVRGDRTIDVLNGGKAVTVLRRETNLQLAMLSMENSPPPCSPRGCAWAISST